MDTVLRLIEELRKEAESENDAMGASEYIRRCYSSSYEPTPEFTRLKERQYLGEYARQYNERFAPALIWARENDRGTGHADFSVYARNQSYLCDIEMTALFTKPVSSKPRGYEDYSPYLPALIPAKRVIPDVSLWDIDNPRSGYRPYSRLERIIEMHLRSAYRPYWLVIYDNEHGVQHPNLNQLEKLIRLSLEKKASRGRLPANLRQVWAFVWPSFGASTLVRAWP